MYDKWNLQLRIYALGTVHCLKMKKIIKSKASYPPVNTSHEPSGDDRCSGLQDPPPPPQLNPSLTKLKLINKCILVEIRSLVQRYISQSTLASLTDQIFHPN